MKSAEAEGSRSMNEALVGEGGRNLVALEAIRRLNVTDVTFPSTGYEWFNSHEMASRLGAGDDVSGAPRAAAQVPAAVLPRPVPAPPPAPAPVKQE